jgi:hypothetical protein
MNVSTLIGSGQTLDRRCFPHFCSKSSSLHTLSYLVIKMITKDVARIYDMAIHIIIELGKIAIYSAKIPYSILARLYRSTLNYNIGKEVFTHLSFSGYHFASMCVSFTNTMNEYLKNKMEKGKNFSSTLSLSPKKNMMIQEEKSKMQMKKESRDENLFFQEYPKYSVNHSPILAEKMAKIFVESSPKLFHSLYAEYVENHKGKKKIDLKATTYAKNCIRIYSAIYLKFLKESSEKKAQEQALLYAKTYVNTYSKECKRQLKTQSKEKTEKQADIYANYFTKLFFSEYRRCLENTPKTAEIQAMTFAEKYIEIFYKICPLLSETLKEKVKEITASLFKEYIHKIPELIKNEIDVELYFQPYAQKYVDCQTDGRKKSATKIAALHATRHVQKPTPEKTAPCNRIRLPSV